MKQEAEKRLELERQGHGTYSEISEADFLETVTKTENVVVHFYHKVGASWVGVWVGGRVVAACALDCRTTSAIKGSLLLCCCAGVAHTKTLLCAVLFCRPTTAQHRTLSAAR